MLVNFFEKSDILRFISTLLLLALMFWKSFYLIPPEEGFSDVHFLFFTNTPQYNIILSLLLILLEGILLFISSNQFKLIANDSLLVMVSYLLLMGLFPSFVYFPEFYILQILFSLFIFLCFYISRKEIKHELLFWTSFIIGVLVLIDTIFFILIPLVLIYFLIIDQINIRTLLILLFGISMPFLLSTSFHFLFDIVNSPIVFSWKDFQFNSFRSDYLSFILFFIMLFAGYKTFEKLARHLILQKNLFLFVSLLSFTFLLFAFQASTYIQLYAIVPASFLVGRTLEHLKTKLWKDLYFFTLLLFVLSQNILNLNFL